jgi:3alpha(or 20beta)-hydroxysteroid dehydrogenase
MHNSLDGRVAIITGSGGGIGRASAQALALAGAHVVAVDISQSAAEAVATELGEGGSKALALQADVSDPDHVQRFVSTTLETFGRIDILFNNAGIEGAVAPIATFPLDVFDRVLAVNLRSVFIGLKYVLPLMVAQRSGSIINSSSVSGMRGTAGFAGYVASKHAVIGLTRVAAAEAASANVRVNAICPGPIGTRMMDSISALSSPDDPEEAVRASIDKNPSRRWGTPEEVAAVVLFLASDASSYVNGAAWPIDGGRTAV